MTTKMNEKTAVSARTADEQSHRGKCTQMHTTTPINAQCTSEIIHFALG
jgi:hypothetical protein